MELGVIQIAHPSLFEQFQSAGRIWGFWNPSIRSKSARSATVFQSAGRIWGFWNVERINYAKGTKLFQSAGRIWGFWNFFRFVCSV